MCISCNNKRVLRPIVCPHETERLPPDGPFSKFHAGMKLFIHDTNKCTFDRYKYNLISLLVYTCLYRLQRWFPFYLFSLKKKLFRVTFLSICFTVCCLLRNRLVASEYRMFHFICDVSKNILNFQIIFVCIKGAFVGVKNEQMDSNKMHE